MKKRIIIDVSYWAYTRAYACQKASEENRCIPIFADIEQLINNDTILAFDGQGSIRKDHLPWYKARRDKLDEKSQALQKQAKELMLMLKKEYPNNVYEEKGLEGDDIVAIHAVKGDFLLSNDKDYLQLPSNVVLSNLRFEYWGVERFKTELPVKRGASSLAFQLLYGDYADDIPRRYYGDRATVQAAFESSNPLLAAINLIPLQQARVSLAALMLPTPLIDMRVDIIDQALMRYV